MKAVKTIKSILGYLWAVLALILIMVLFPSLNTLSEQVARLPFMKISPLYQGGIPDREIDRGTYKIVVNKPVFESLTGKARKGFVQVKWEGAVPDMLTEVIDYNNDSSPDFTITLNNNGDPELTAGDKNVTGIDIWARTEKGWIVRVGLSR